MAPTSTFTAHPFLHEKLPYDVRDLIPIARVSNTVIAVGVPTAAGINSVNDLIARAKAEPGKLNSASATGANDFVVSGYLKQANADITRVPYRDTVQAVNDLSEDRLQVYTSSYAIQRPQREAGRINELDGGRGVYFDDPSGHLLEAITRPYGSGGTTTSKPHPLLTEPRTHGRDAARAAREGTSASSS